MQHSVLVTAPSMIHGAPRVWKQTLAAGDHRIAAGRRPPGSRSGGIARRIGKIVLGALWPATVVPAGLLSLAAAAISLLALLILPVVALSALVQGATALLLRMGVLP